MQIIGCFIPFLILFLFTQLLVLICNRKFGECMPLSIMAITFIEYFSQYIFHTFYYGVYFIIALSAISVVLFLIIIKVKHYQVVANVFSYGFYCFAVIVVFIFIVDFKRRFNQWDELSHWGMMVKEMLRLDCFYTELESHLLAYHREYPPFIQIFQTFWCILRGYYSEMSVTMALHFVILSFIVPFATDTLNFNFNNRINGFVKIFLGFVIIWLIILLFDPEKILPTIYLEIVVPVIFAYSICLIYLKDVFDNLFDFILLIMASSSLLLIKQIGIAFYMLIIFYYIINLVITLKRNNSITIIKGGLRILETLFLFLFPMLIKKSWEIYVSKIIQGGQFSLSKINTKELVLIISHRGSEIQNATLESFYQALFNKPIVSGFIPLSYMAAYIVLVIIIICFSKYIFQNKQEMLIILSLYTCGTIGYGLTLGILYMFCFSEAEMARLASYERYMASYLLGEILILLFLFIYNLNSKKTNVFRMKNILMSLFILLCVCPSNIYFLVPHFQTSTMRKMEKYAGFLSENVDKDQTVFLIADSNGDYQFFINYFCNEIRIDRKYFNILSIDYSDSKLKNEIMNDISSLDYVFVITTNENVNEAFMDITKDKKLKTNTLYKVDNKNDDLYLYELNSMGE